MVLQLRGVTAFRARRQGAGISQEQVAAQAGVSSATVRNFEAGRPVRPSTARILAVALAALERTRSRRVADRQEVCAYLLDLPTGEFNRLVADVLAERVNRDQALTSSH